MLNFHTKPKPTTSITCYIGRDSSAWSIMEWRGSKALVTVHRVAYLAVRWRWNEFYNIKISIKSASLQVVLENLTLCSNATTVTNSIGLKVNGPVLAFTTRHLRIKRLHWWNLGTATWTTARCSHLHFPFILCHKRLWANEVLTQVSSCKLWHRFFSLSFSPPSYPFLTCHFNSFRCSSPFYFSPV